MHERKKEKSNAKNERNNESSEHRPEMNIHTKLSYSYTSTHACMCNFIHSQHKVNNHTQNIQLSNCESMNKIVLHMWQDLIICIMQESNAEWTHDFECCCRIWLESSTHTPHSSTHPQASQWVEKKIVKMMEKFAVKKHNSQMRRNTEICDHIACANSCCIHKKLIPIAPTQMNAQQNELHQQLNYFCATHTIVICYFKETKNAKTNAPTLTLPNRFNMSIESHQHVKPLKWFI